MGSDTLWLLLSTALLKWSKNINADCLSRLSWASAPAQLPVPGETHKVLQHVDTAVTVTNICVWTCRDPTASKVYDYVLSVWSDVIEDEIHAYYNRRSDLSTQDGVLLMGSRFVIPKQGQARMLAKLHETHPRVVRMKALNRSYILWPGLDTDIERMVKQCQTYQVNRKIPPPSSLHPHEWPSRPWVKWFLFWLMHTPSG